MAQPNERSTAGRPGSPLPICYEACKADDVSLMKQAISMASEPNSRFTVKAVVERGLRRSAARRAVHVLKYLIDHPHGADVTALKASQIMANEGRDETSQEILKVLEILVAHGWDINTQGPDEIPGWPLLWFLVRYPDLIRWCIDHGARLDVPDNPPEDMGNWERRSAMPHPTILGMAASQGSIETFELLRANEAPLDSQTLNGAVARAIVLAPDEGSEPSPFYAERLNMIRHLVDVVKLDVNAVRHLLGRECSTPLCIVAKRATNQIYHQLVYLLLDRGANPNLNGTTPEGTSWPSAIACAQAYGNRRFLQAVKDWQVEKQGETQG